MDHAVVRARATARTSPTPGPAGSRARAGTAPPPRAGPPAGPTPLPPPGSRPGGTRGTCPCPAVRPQQRIDGRAGPEGGARRGGGVGAAGGLRQVVPAPTGRPPHGRTGSRRRNGASTPTARAAGSDGAVQASARGPLARSRRDVGPDGVAHPCPAVRPAATGPTTHRTSGRGTGSASRRSRRGSAPDEGPGPRPCRSAVGNRAPSGRRPGGDRTGTTHRTSSRGTGSAAQAVGGTGPSRPGRRGVALGTGPVPRFRVSPGRGIGPEPVGPMPTVGATRRRRGGPRRVAPGGAGPAAGRGAHGPGHMACAASGPAGFRGLRPPAGNRAGRHRAVSGARPGGSRVGSGRRPGGGLGTGAAGRGGGAPSAGQAWADRRVRASV